LSAAREDCETVPTAQATAGPEGLAYTCPQGLGADPVARVNRPRRRWRARAKMSLRDKLEMTGVTDVGLKRSHNEDCLALDPALGVAVLADGMGGYKAGEVASAMAVDVVLEAIRKGVRQVHLEEVDEETGYTRGALVIRDAVAKANAAILQAAQDRPGCRGMGTTLVSLLFYDNRVSVAHVGDSRLYRLRADQLEQITVDHSMVQELVDRGFYTPEEARRNVQKNLVTRAVGVDESVRTDLLEEPVQEGDVYLACSDGLTDLVEDADIQSILVQHRAELGAAARHLVEQAKASGGTDNISVVLVQALRPFPARARARWYTRVLDWFT
jgi:protein phosphatase